MRSQTVLVTDAGGGPATAIIRSLGRAGYRVVAGGSRLDAPGLRSRYAAHRLRYPPPGLKPDEFTAAVREAVTDFGVDLIIPVSDAALLPLARARHDLAAARLAAPHDEAVEIAISKSRTIELAQQLGVPVPQTRLAFDADDALRGATEVGYPVVLKPDRTYRFDGIHGAQRIGVTFANDAAEAARLAGAAHRTSPMLIQAYAGGVGVGLELLAREGEPVMAFQHRRIREMPVSGGASSMRESVRLDPDLYAHACRLAAALRWTGLMMVEFKAGTNGPLLMEINGRPWGSLPLAVSAGADFPVALTRMLLDDQLPAAEIGTYRTGVRGRNLELDLRWAINVALQRRQYDFLPFPRRAKALAPLIDLLRPSVRDDLLSLEDPMPGARHLVDVTRRLIRRALG